MQVKRYQHIYTYLNHAISVSLEIPDELRHSAHLPDGPKTREASALSLLSAPMPWSLDDGRAVVNQRDSARRLLTNSPSGGIQSNVSSVICDFATFLKTFWGSKMTQTLILMILHIRNMNDEAGKSGHELLCFCFRLLATPNQSNSKVICIHWCYV